MLDENYGEEKPRISVICILCEAVLLVRVLLCLPPIRHLSQNIMHILTGDNQTEPNPIIEVIWKL